MVQPKFACFQLFSHKLNHIFFFNKFKSILKCIFLRNLEIIDDSNVHMKLSSDTNIRFFSPYLFLVWFLCLNGLCIKTIGFTSGLFFLKFNYKDDINTFEIIHEKQDICVQFRAARYLLYPGNNILLCFGIYLTVAIAVERWYCLLLK